MAKRFEELKKEVIDKGFCVHCGACSAFCNRIKLNASPQLVGKCVESCSSPYGTDGVCYEHCPMVKSFDEKHIFQRNTSDPLGIYISLKSARAHDNSLNGVQDGGVATALLKAAFEDGEIDAAIVVGRDELWRSQPKIAWSVKDLIGTSGSKYTETPVIELVGKLSREGASSVAVVAVPCQIQALRNLEYGLLYPNGFSPYSDMMLYTIGLFCSGVFNYKELVNRLDVDLKYVDKMDIKDSKFKVEGKITKTLPLSRVKKALLPACKYCRDYTARLADISLGSVGSPKGWTTVIVRNPNGSWLLTNAKNLGLIEVKRGLSENVLRTHVDKRIKNVSKECMKANEIPPSFK